MKSPRQRMRTAMIALATTATLLITPFAPDAVAKPAVPNRATVKGPVGWDTYRHLEAIPILSVGVANKQFSSFDRTGGNGQDGFNGAFSCLRTIAEGCVLAEATGAGEINSIWFTRDWGNVGATGNIVITLDGVTVLNAPVQDVVDGKLGGPFAAPFVANADTASGGVYIKVPMTYRQSMRVSTTKNPLFYHVGHRAFADADGVSTFDPTYVPKDVFSAAATWGHQDPKPPARGITSATALRVPAGGSQVIATASKGGLMDELKLQLPEIIAPPERPEITDDGRAFTGSSQFRVAVDPGNDGVRLTRRLDSGIPGQTGRVFVDGVHVADWPSYEASAGGWWDASIDIPAQHTAGKSSIVVRTEFTPGALDFNEFRYFVDSTVAGESKRTDEVDVGASTVARASEKAHDYQVQGEVWQGERTYTYPDDGSTESAVLASNALLRDLRLRIRADGLVTVDAPLGEFFGTGLSRAEVRAMYFAADRQADGFFTSWWPMPYRKTLTVELVNQSDVPVTTGTAWTTTVRDGSMTGKLSGANPGVGYFQAQTRRGATVPDRDWTLLDVSGVGKVVGVSQTVRGTMEFGNTREYLEGDERVHVDGSLSPAWHGTGTEDFYEAGWYFREVVEFTTPWVGDTMIQFGTDGCAHKCDSMYRVLVPDAIGFSSDMKFSIEHGGENKASAEYGTTAFWYGHEDRPASRVTDTLDVGVPAAEAAHRYRGGDAPVALTSTFEGDDDGIAVADEFRSSTAAVTFTMATDPANRAVELRRLSDQRVGYQAVDVAIDGRAAGRWLQPLANEHHRWLEDDFQVPPALTRGKSRITVTLTPVKGAPAWTAARYEARSRGALRADTTRPGPVATATATATVDGSGSVGLAWKRAVDDVAVDHYEVAAAQRAGFAPGPQTVVGTTPVPGFAHTGLGLAETWFYRVRAVDAAGNVGPWSPEVSGTTGRRLVVEGESLLPALSADMPVEAQANCCGAAWSGGSQLWLRATAADQSATFAVDVPEDGTYALAAVLTQAPDYGRVQFSVDGRPVGPVVDGYRAEGVGTTKADLASVSLTKGEHTLAITAAGRNPASRGAFIGVDRLDLTLQ